ncbi:MAG: hypothetical protein IT443_02565 [Phycisphaeraceae bacterium]|nr:hypothetical protein [Phycisphaeraceae bacterium]
MNRWLFFVAVVAMRLAFGLTLGGILGLYLTARFHSRMWGYQNSPLTLLVVICLVFAIPCVATTPGHLYPWRKDDES